MLPQMPGPDSSKRTIPPGPSSLPMYSRAIGGPPSVYTQAVPPMGQPTSVPLMSAGPPQSNIRPNMMSNIGPPPSQISNIGPPPMQGFVKK